MKSNFSKLSDGQKRELQECLDYICDKCSMRKSEGEGKSKYWQFKGAKYNEPLIDLRDQEGIAFDEKTNILTICPDSLRRIKKIKRDLSKAIEGDDKKLYELSYDKYGLNLRINNINVRSPNFDSLTDKFLSKMEHGKVIAGDYRKPIENLRLGEFSKLFFQSSKSKTSVKLIITLKDIKAAKLTQKTLNNELKFLTGSNKVSCK